MADAEMLKRAARLVQAMGRSEESFQMVAALNALAARLPELERDAARYRKRRTADARLCPEDFDRECDYLQEQPK